MLAWFVIVDGFACAGPGDLMLGTVTVLSYLIALIGLRAAMAGLERRGRHARPTLNSEVKNPSLVKPDSLDRLVRLAGTAMLAWVLYLCLANLALLTGGAKRFAYWLNIDPVAPVPGGFGCHGHAHWMFYALFAASLLTASSIVRKIEKRRASNAPA
jgi:hypothetical protein